MASRFPKTRGAQPAPVSELEQLEAELARLESAPAPTEIQTLEAELAGLEKSTKEAEPWYEDFGEGVAVSGMETYYGAKDLFGQMDDEDRATLKDWKEDAAESGWGTAGQVVGELGQFMVPGGAALKGVKGLNYLRNAGKAKKLATVAAAEGAVGAGVSGVRLPDEGETRLGNVALGAAGGAGGAYVGAGLARGLSKTMRGITKTPAAKQLISEGIELTPGQSATSQFVRGAENVMEVTPFLARGTKDAKKVAKEQWNQKILQEAAPDGAQITKLGTEGAKQLKDAVTKAYTDAWAGAGAVTRQTSIAIHGNLVTAAKRLSKSDTRVLQNVSDDIVKAVQSGDKKALQTMDDTLRRQIASAGTKKHELRAALQVARDTLRASAPDANQVALQAIDATYPAYLTARDAVKNSLDDAGVFTPSRLNKSVKKIGKNLAATGEAAVQKSAAEGMETVGRKEGGQPLEWFRRIASAVPSVLPMKTGGRAMLGQTAPQQAGLRMARNPRAQAMRELFSSGGVGATVANQ